MYCMCVRVQNGLTALHLASKEGHVHVVAELLRRDADIDIATKVAYVGVIESAVGFVSTHDFGFLSGHLF